MSQPDINDVLRAKGTDAVRERHDRAHRKAEPSANNEDRSQAQRTGLPALHYADLTKPLVPRQWLVPDLIPMFNVTLLSGEGAIGKSLLAMQLSAATVMLGMQWIGLKVQHGSVLYLSCEEEEDEGNNRFEDIAKNLGVTRERLAEAGLHFLPRVGEDTILAEPNRFGVLKPTPLYEAIKLDVIKIKPKLIVIDTTADTFAGEERNRAQTRQYITLLRALAIAGQSAVLLLAHPSLEGIRSESGLSGSTGWHNSVRGRMYFRPHEEITALRVLECKKNNYGPVTASVSLRWSDGVFIREDSSQRHGPDADDVDDLFMSLLRRFTDTGRTVSDKVSPSYAPTRFELEPESKRMKISKAAFAASMARLFAANKIRVEPDGPPSRRYSKIVIVTGQPTNTTTTTSMQKISKFQIVGPSDDQCEHCFGIDPDRDGQKVYLIRDPFRGVASHALHERCADDFYRRSPVEEG
jgi:RecA-family ATPase